MGDRRAQRAVSAAVALSLAAAGALTACATGGSMTDATPAASARPPFLTASANPAPMATPAAVPASRWDAIAADLADRDVVGAPELVSADTVTWPNGALGCPAPGRSYTQQVVEGMRVVVRADGRTWDYRFGAAGGPRLCEGRPLPTSSR